MASSGLEVLWSVPATHFRYKPAKLWTDKFGCSFVVYCTAVEGSSLELWLPPDNYGLCMTSHFHRCCIPFAQGTVVAGVTVESMSGSRQPHVLILCASGELQLWLQHDETLVHACSMIISDLTNSKGRVFLNFKAPSESVMSEIGVLVGGRDTVLELALHYPGKGTQMWQGAGMYLSAPEQVQMHFTYNFRTKANVFFSDCEFSGIRVAMITGTNLTRRRRFWLLRLLLESRQVLLED
jgi:hypothetical protein